MEKQITGNQKAPTQQADELVELVNEKETLEKHQNCKMMDPSIPFADLPTHILKWFVEDH